jgi:hypothetical protein
MTNEVGMDTDEKFERVYAQLDRIEDKLEKRLDKVDERVLFLEKGHAKIVGGAAIVSFLIMACGALHWIVGGSGETKSVQVPPTRTDLGSAVR